MDNVIHWLTVSRVRVRFCFEMIPNSAREACGVNIDSARFCILQLAAASIFPPYGFCIQVSLVFNNNDNPNPIVT